MLERRNWGNDRKSPKQKKTALEDSKKIRDDEEKWRKMLKKPSKDSKFSEVLSYLFLLYRT